MSGAQVALFIAFVVVATLAQGLTGFAFVLVLLGLAGLFQLAPVTDLANVRVGRDSCKTQQKQA